MLLSCHQTDITPWYKEDKKLANSNDFMTGYNYSFIYTLINYEFTYIRKKLNISTISDGYTSHHMLHVSFFLSYLTLNITCLGSNLFWNSGICYKSMTGFVLSTTTFYFLALSLPFSLKM